MRDRDGKWYFGYSRTVIENGRKVREEVKVPLRACTKDVAIAEGKAKLADLLTLEKLVREVQSRWMKPPTGPFMDGIRNPCVFPEILL